MWANISGATIVASLSTTNLGHSGESLPQVIFSLGTAPEYEPYDVVESEIWQKYCHSIVPFHCRSCSIIGTQQIGKSPAVPPPIWKNPVPRSIPGRLLALYQSTRCIIVSIPPFTRCGSNSPLMQCAVKMLPVVESSHAGTIIGMFFSHAASTQLSLGSIS